MAGPKTRSGLTSRRVALNVTSSVMDRRQSLDDALAHAFGQPDAADLESRDRAFVRLLATTVLRRHGQLDALVSGFLAKPLPAEAGRVRTILELGAAQLVFLAAPPHAVIDTAVSLARGHKRSYRFSGLVNAVLRRVAEGGNALLANHDAAVVNTPEWLLASWSEAYGPEAAHAIADACLAEATLDITPKDNPGHWAAELAGTLLPTGTIRCANASGRIEDMPGFDAGAWWVQDFAAALPARLFGPLAGLRIADLCAAPGGKTAQLAAGGASVFAIDKSPARLARVEANMARLGLSARIEAADVMEWAPDGPLDGILLDAPCSATGTIRRHPDILHNKEPGAVAALADLQRRMLEHCAEVLTPGARLVYCTCSLQPEEGPDQIARTLSDRDDLEREPIAPEEIGGLGALITADGDIRTLPHFSPDGADVPPGMDGFYVSRLRKRG